MGFGFVKAYLPPAWAGCSQWLAAIAVVLWFPFYNDRAKGKTNSCRLLLQNLSENSLGFIPPVLKSHQKHAISSFCSRLKLEVTAFSRNSEWRVSRESGQSRTQEKGSPLRTFLQTACRKSKSSTNSKVPASSGVFFGVCPFVVFLWLRFKTTKTGHPFNNALLSQTVSLVAPSHPLSFLALVGFPFRPLKVKLLAGGSPVKRPLLIASNKLRLWLLHTPPQKPFVTGP